MAAKWPRISLARFGNIRLAHVILVFRAAHSLAAGKSLRRRFGPGRSQPGGVERGMQPLLNDGHDPAEYVAIARAVGVDPYKSLAQAENEVGGRHRRIDLTLSPTPW